MKRDGAAFRLKARLAAGGRQLASGSEAQEIAEAAVVLPIVFMLLFGIIWFGRAYNIYTTITYAAREGAKVAAQPNCAMCAAAANNVNAVHTRVVQVLQASHIDPSKMQAYTPAPAPALGNCPSPPAAGSATNSGVTLYTNVQLNINPSGNTGPAECGVMVTFQYPFQFYFPFTSINKQIVNLKAVAGMQVED
jgi:Flp pilus assembly protein TadG